MHKRVKMRRNNYIEENNTQSEGSPYLNMKEKLQNSYIDGEYEASICNDINESILSAKDIIINQMKKAEAESLCRLNRPKVRLFPQILYLGLFITFLIIGFALADNISQAINIDKKVIVAIVLLVVFMIVFFFSKSFCIWIIEIYQKYAPSKVRLSCRFEPTCSQYMKLAIYKYGVLKGVIKGVKRLTRCHPPNGGEDYP